MTIALAADRPPQSEQPVGDRQRDAPGGELRPHQDPARALAALVELTEPGEHREVH